MLLRPQAVVRARWFALAMILIVGLGGGLGCRRAVDTGAGLMDEGPPNIVVFLIDTLRADRLGTYGYHRRPTSPRLDEFATDAVVFVQAYAPSPWTLPTVASVASSTFGCDHGVVNDNHRLPAGLTTLAERLAGHGYLTMGLYGNAYAGPAFGLDRGFEHYTYSRKNDAAKVAPMLDLAAADGRPFLLYVHNMEPHGGERFNGPSQSGFLPEVSRDRREELLERFNAYRKLTRVDFARKQLLGTTDNTTQQRRELDFMTEHYDEHDVLYDAAVRLADGRFGSVLDLLCVRGIWEDTVVVFLSDHGEELGEHGGWQHDQSVYEELIRVPLLIRFPDDEHAGRRVRQVVSVVDVAPTLLRLAGTPVEGSVLRGRDLGGLLEGGRADDDSELVITAVRDNQKKYYAPWKARRGDLNIAVREGSLKAIVNIEVGTVELYDLEVDMAEKSDLARVRPEDAARLGAFAYEWLADCGGGESAASELDEETLERLRTLGYVD
jgi:arylsulfatase A-like enzyme